ncbi:NADH dehydrogenase [Platysternon megacephalum]|uniref:NADH dehydrogenase n=1 Tax=Platysternon megacephalum TaxID=55544 RepID=A0A4D9FAM9_9SAUR|nr:NADH dehydrogenase [Platysternon megacephalum]
MSHVIRIQSKQSELQTIQTHETGLKKKKKLLPKISCKLSANNLEEGGEILQIICPVQIRIRVQMFKNSLILYLQLIVAAGLRGQVLAPVVQMGRPLKLHGNHLASSQEQGSASIIYSHAYLIAKLAFYTLQYVVILFF